MNGIFEYQEGEGFLYKTNPITKISISLIVIILAAFTFSLVRVICLLAFITIITLLSLRFSVRSLSPYLKICIFISLTTIPTQGLFYWEFYLGELHDVIWIIKPEKLQSLPVIGHIFLWITYGRGLGISWKGIMYGILTSLKFSLTILIGAMIVLTTKPGDIVRTLAAIGIPRALIYTSLISIRFIPLLIEEGKIAIIALRMRGGGRTLRDVTSFIKRALYAIILNTIRRAKVLAIALELKGFRYNKERRDKINFKKEDAMLLLTSIIVAIIIYSLP